MHWIFVILICLMNSIAFCINPENLKLFDTSSSSTQSSSIVSTSSQSTSLSSSETSSKSSSSSTTYHPKYPDTFSPGAITGVAIASFILIFLISMGSYYIRRQRLYYLPYYNNYRPI